MGVTSQIFKNKLAISCNIYFNIVKHVPFPSWVTPILPKEPHSPLLAVLHPITRNIIPRTQRIPDHSITPPLEHISLKETSLPRECPFSPSRSLHYSSRILPFKGECPFSPSKSFFRSSRKPPTLGNAHSPYLEIPSIPRDIPSSRNTPSSHWEVPSP